MPYISIDWAPVFYFGLTVLLTIAILALAGALRESNRTHKVELAAETEETEGDEQ